jgi:hypothetical protein
VSEWQTASFRDVIRDFEAKAKQDRERMRLLEAVAVAARNMKRAQRELAQLPEYDVSAQSYAQWAETVARLDSHVFEAQEVFDAALAALDGKEASATATLARVPVLTDPAIHEVMEDVEYYSTGDPDEGDQGKEAKE